jgi:hypothetical protein
LSFGELESEGYTRRELVSPIGEGKPPLPDYATRVSIAPRFAMANLDREQTQI